jgi:ribonuclease Z
MTAAIEVMLLGTGVPLPSADRCGAGYVIVAGGERVMLDCGWGAARRLFAAGIQPPLIDTLCLTHMHSDHITDVPDFLISRWTGCATKPLKVYGPVGTRETIDGFLAALRLDIGYRFAHHGEKLSRDGIVCDVRELPATAEPREVVTIGDLLVESFGVDHRPVEPALGYRFSARGRTAVFSGDSVACTPLTNAAKGADLFVSDALNRGMFDALVAALRAAGREGPASLLDDVPGYHASTLDAATMARDAGVKHLVLSHLIPPIPNEGPLTDAFTAGMSDIYSGQITLGRDLQRISIEE